VGTCRENSARTCSEGGRCARAISRRWTCRRRATRSAEGLAAFVIEEVAYSRRRVSRHGSRASSYGDLISELAERRIPTVAIQRSRQHGSRITHVRVRQAAQLLTSVVQRRGGQRLRYVAPPLGIERVVWYLRVHALSCHHNGMRMEDAVDNQSFNNRQSKLVRRCSERLVKDCRIRAPQPRRSCKRSTSGESP